MTDKERPNPDVASDNRPWRKVEFKDVWRTIAASAREFVERYQNEGRKIAVAAAVGGVVVGGFVWLWRGDWGGGVNPLEWNAYARSDFFESIQVGVVVGGLIGVVAAIRRRRRNT